MLFSTNFNKSDTSFNKKNTERNYLSTVEILQLLTHAFYQLHLFFIKNYV